MKKKLVSFISALVLSVASLSAVPLIKVAAAGTDTWTGTDCTGDSPNCNWSDDSNWSADAPSGGEDLVFDNSIIGGENSPIDDISGLSVNSITFTNDYSGSATVELDQDLTVVSAITQASSVTSTEDFITSGVGVESATITLGGNVTVTSSGSDGFTIGYDSDVIALAGNTLTFAGGAFNDAVDAAITGSGSVVYNNANTNFQINGANTYSGTTDVIASDLQVSGGSDTDPFGSSTVTVGTAGAIGFDYSTSQTISNPIIIAGTTNDSPITSVDFDNTEATGAMTLTVPNITLNGNTRFSNDSTSSTPLTVDLAGIQTNGYCAEYLAPGLGSEDDTNGPANGFTNGPTGCQVNSGSSGSSGSGSSSSSSSSSKKAPKTPDTGLALVSAHPAITLLGTIMLAGGVYLLYRKVKASVRA